MKAVGYIRVSTEDQAREGVSLDNQRERVRNFCSAKEWTLDKIISDAGYSAKDLNRPGIQDVMKLAREKGFDVLVICKLDRMTRNIRDLGYLTKDFMVSLHSCRTESIIPLSAKLKKPSPITR